MRYIYLLIITFIFASCGNQKLRFSRVHSTKQKVVEISDTPTLKVESETAFNSEISNELYESENSIDPRADKEADELKNQNVINDPEVIYTYIPPIEQDSSKVSSQTDVIDIEARNAEEFGTWSLILSLLVYAFAICLLFALLASAYSETALLASIFVFAFFALGLASLIGSFILGIKSLRAPYNTQKGRRKAIIGIIISSVITAAILFSLAMSFLN